MKRKVIRDGNVGKIAKKNFMKKTWGPNQKKEKKIDGT